MTALLPIAVQSLVHLADAPISLQEKSFRYGCLSLESPRYVCVKDVAADGSSQVVVVDLRNNNAVTRQPTKQADAALMHTHDSIIVVRRRNENGEGHVVKVFDLESKRRLVEHLFNEEIVFWKWASSKLLAVVTTKSVWHLSLEPNVAAVRVFDRGGRLAEPNVQIINYAVDASGKWCLLAGISTQDKKTIDGSLQLYSVERRQQQFLDGHAGCFGTLVIGDAASPPISVFAFAERKNGAFSVHIMYIDVARDSQGAGNPPPSFKVGGSFAYPADCPQDFPISMHLSATHGVLFIMSRGGHLVLIDPMTAVVVLMRKLSNDTVFVTCADSERGGILFVNRKGVLFQVSVQEDALVPYIQQTLVHLPNTQEIAQSFVKRYGYPGSDEILIQLFNSVFARGDFKGAARVAAACKNTQLLRTAKTIQQFKAAQPLPGQTSPILQYFCTLLEQGRLNALESCELVRPVVEQGRDKFVENWLNEDKLECTEVLGDLVKRMDAKLALRIYEKADAASKVLQCYLELGQYDKIIDFAMNTRQTVDYSLYLRSVASAAPEGGVTFAKQLLSKTPPLIDVDTVVEIFTQQGRLQEVTSILLDYLKENRADQGQLQTKLLELNLLHSPQVAEAIFQMNKFTHYDRARIAELCEKAGLTQRALEHSSDHSDIKRILAMHAGGGAGGSQINSEWLIQYFGKLAPDVCLDCLSDMLRTNRQNLQVVVQVAVKYYEQVGTMRIVAMLESFGSWEGIFYFLGSVIAFSTDPDVHFKYIEAASKLNHMQEVERVCRECQHYDPVRVKDFLKQAKLVDPRPLIYVCDLHGFVPELTEYLYKNSLLKYIEVYVIKVSPQKTPLVIGVLFDLNCAEDFIKSLLQNVRGACSVEQLVQEVEKRNRLRVLLPWLEARSSEGNQDPNVHNALAKIYIDTNRDPETFLKTNAFYDSKVVGKYCEDRDPHLAYTAYKKDWGSCDRELVELTRKNGLFRLQARYLVERQSPELWNYVLNPENESRQAVVDQVVAYALPESTNPEEVSVAVRAFIDAKLPNALMELLEKIVLHNSDFSKNKNLQNLLILTALKSDASRVMDYINRLDNYDGPGIAQAALSDDYRMYNEAVTVYKKCNMHEEAIRVILDKQNDIERAAEYAERCQTPAVWSRLAQAQLKQGMVTKAIESFLKAEDATFYKEVIEQASDYPADLIRFLDMARKTMPSKDASIDTEMVYALAKSNRLTEMEDFVSGSNTANVGAVGDRLFEEGNYKAAKVLYASIPNFSKLASCHTKLGEFAEALDAAKRAGSPKTWKEVNIACVQAKDFRSAHIGGLAIVGHPDHLEELINNYERLGHFEELIALIEAGVATERPPIALFSELGVIYAKYRPEKLSAFIRSSSIVAGRLNIPKLIRACERHELWKESVFLHVTYEEYDQAALTMMAHPQAWSHTEFLSCIQKVANSDIYDKAFVFYLDVAPLQLNELLIAVSPKLDHGRVVQQFRKLGHLKLLQAYLEHVQNQKNDLAAVNEALNDIYFEGEDVDALQRSISEYPNFDQLELAKRLEHHPLLAFRRLASFLYRKNGQYEQAIALAKKDGNFHDAMEAAKSSGSKDIAESLLTYFVEQKNKEAFTACLFVCYGLLRPDVVMELAWRHGFYNQIMPYVLQVMREYTTRLDALEKKVAAQQRQGENLHSAPNDYVPDYMMSSSVPTPPLGNSTLALMPPSSNRFGVPIKGMDGLSKFPALESGKPSAFGSSAAPSARLFL